MKDNNDLQIGKKFQALRPWLKGNNSITPANFYEKYNPDLHSTVFIALDLVVPLHLAHQVDTGNTEDVREKNIDYIHKALKIAIIDEEDCGMPLAEDEREEILQALKEPPESSYNIYLITIFDDSGFEKVVYVGRTDSDTSRFQSGHKAALKLHDPKYKAYDKRVYFGTITFLADNEKQTYLPLECFSSKDDRKRLLSNIEKALIKHFDCELNIQKPSPEIVSEATIHIQNFTNVSKFLDDAII